jgi:hypothetical protein
MDKYEGDELQVIWNDVLHTDSIQAFINDSLFKGQLNAMDVIITVGMTGDYVKQSKEHFLAGCAGVVRDWFDIKKKKCQTPNYDPVVNLYFEIEILVEKYVK